ncbi:MAG TPA: hypothetical protein VEW69_12535, partial [Alphaproteobacteria bacterium]|nr:hypothetical protein [Alphaproteobacteria bacterium]
TVMKWKLFRRFAALCAALSVSMLAGAQNLSQMSQGNARAEELGHRSPVVQSAYAYLVQQAQTIGDPALKKETLDALTNPTTCILHRARLGEADKKRIVAELIRARLVDRAQNASFPGGIVTGVFPPVAEDGTACPHLPQSFLAAPGSSFGGHHSYPGGLAVHEAMNERASLDLAANYRERYGKGWQAKGTADILIDQDIMIAAPIWHDWAKTIVFQWNADGTEFPELSLGGAGTMDNNFAAGDSRTGAHHILGLAEAMKRGLSPEMLITIASAHAAPTRANEFKVVNWLRTAAIIAQVDPVEKGYVERDKRGRFHLAAVRKLDELPLDRMNPPQTNFLAEYALHNLSDSDFTYSVAAMESAQLIILQLAPDFGFDPTSTSTEKYNNSFRNPVLSYLTAERIFILYSEKGLAGVRAELEQLRREKVIP